MELILTTAKKHGLLNPCFLHAAPENVNMSGWYEPWFLLHLAPEPSMVDPRTNYAF